MRLVKPIIKQKSFSPPIHPPPPSNSTLFAKNIVIVIVVMFFICGVLHFLVRFILNKIRLSLNPHHESRRFQESGDGESVNDAAIYQRQLQQLFNLHDSGLDQSSIDALPVFSYNELKGFKEHHHCAVCLCEFTEHDKLRLLPVCSHAFHTHCIDTWLLSNSTCPLCRGNLFTPGFSVINPVFDFDFDFDFDFGFDHVHSREEEEEEDDDVVSGNTNECERVYPVRLGKFRAIDGEKEDKQEVGQTSNGNNNNNNNLDERRCYSMGSYEYVVANSDLQVAFCGDKGRNGNIDLRIEKDKMKKVTNSNNNSSIHDEGTNGKEISNGNKGESFSVSKIWLWSKKDHHHKFQDSSTNTWSYPLSM
ncbi:putative transcription factor C2H2 family [Helianthus annuus]|nr:putative transcription factor C2H2 family [Helianthus annuus]KAJ0862894.1 putative transcription factor C2H2 family [Helianthus annuus]KAJ0866726.1 putative transcription factor C2H2 family [Helianthus annuus]